MSEGDDTHVVEYSSVYMHIRVGTCLKGMGHMLWSTVVCILHADQSGDMSEGDGTHVVEYSSVCMQIRVVTLLMWMGHMLWSTVVCILHADQSGDMSEGDGTHVVEYSSVYLTCRSEWGHVWQFCRCIDTIFKYIS